MNTFEPFQGSGAHQDIVSASTPPGASYGPISIVDEDPSRQSSCIIVLKDNLCLRCRAIDLDDLFSTQRLPLRINGYPEPYVFVVDLNATSVELNNSDCPLCKLFGTMVFERNANSRDENINTTCCLVARSGMELVLGSSRIPEIDITLVAVQWSSGESAYLSLLSPAHSEPIFSIKTLNRSHYDINFIKHCITDCRNSHGNFCNQMNKDAVSFFRLIDCQSKKSLKRRQIPNMSLCPMCGVHPRRLATRVLKTSTYQILTTGQK
jgi:hypothetical protein